MAQPLAPGAKVGAAYTRTQTHTRRHTDTQPRMYTHRQSDGPTHHPHSHTDTRAHIYTHSLSLSLCVIHTHTHTHTHTTTCRSLCRFLIFYIWRCYYHWHLCIRMPSVLGSLYTHALCAWLILYACPLCLAHSIRMPSAIGSFYTYAPTFSSTQLRIIHKNGAKSSTAKFKPYAIYE